MQSPERVLPRAIILSVILVALISPVMNLAIISVVPWREAMTSQYIAAEFMERIYGGWAGTTVTMLILWTSAASVFALMLGYSRIPYAAALERPFRIWLYPLPSLIALLGWIFLFLTAEPQFILFGLGTLTAGIVAFVWWRRETRIES